MLDLDARVHLDEIERLAIHVVEIFERPCPTIRDTFGKPNRSGAKIGAHGIGQRHGWRFFPDLLAAALERAFPLEQMDRTGAVAENLHFDMTRVTNEGLDIDPVIAEPGPSLVHRRGECGDQLFSGIGDTDTAPATASGSLDHHRVADPFSHLDRRVETGDTSVAARDHWHACLDGGRARVYLVTHPLDRGRVGAAEGHAQLAYAAGELGALGEEAVTGMHRIRTALRHRFQDRVDVEIGLRRRRRADHDHLIGHPRGQHIAVGFRNDLNRPNTQISRCSDDAHGDLAAVRDQKLLNAGTLRRHSDTSISHSTSPGSMLSPSGAA